MKKWFSLVAVVSVSFALIVAQQAFTNDTQPSVQETVIVLAQKKAEKSSSPSRKKKTFRRRVPNYYGQIGLAKKQREKIYEIQEGYFNEISALQEKIEELEQKRDTEVYGVLSDAQKKIVGRLREAAAKKRKKRSSKKVKSKKS